MRCVIDYAIPPSTVSCLPAGKVRPKPLVECEPKIKAPVLLVVCWPDFRNGDALDHFPSNPKNFRTTSCIPDNHAHVLRRWEGRFSCSQLRPELESDLEVVAIGSLTLLPIPISASFTLKVGRFSEQLLAPDKHDHANGNKENSHHHATSIRRPPSWCQNQRIGSSVAKILPSCARLLSISWRHRLMRASKAV